MGIWSLPPKKRKIKTSSYHMLKFGDLLVLARNYFRLCHQCTEGILILLDKSIMPRTHPNLSDLKISNNAFKKSALIPTNLYTKTKDINSFQTTNTE
jgi:hypothetical protein